MKKNVAIRRALRGDLGIAHEMLGEYVRVEHRAYDPTMSVKWADSRSGRYFLAQCLGVKDHLFIVATYQQRIVGFLIGSIVQRSVSRRQSKSSELSVLYVRPRYRGHGLGTLMSQAFESWSRKHGVSHLSIMVSARNRRAAKLYRRWGYREYNFILEKNLT